MAADRQFGGAVAVPGFVKSITRMFHENIPKWAMLPDDISSTGQIIFRIVAGATTPSEVERFLSTDFRTTAVTLFYRDYSPGWSSALWPASGPLRAEYGHPGRVPFRRRPTRGSGRHPCRGGPGLLVAVRRLLGLAFCGGLLGLGSLRAAGLLSLAVGLSQAVMLLVQWAASIDLNIHTLPVILAAMGTVVLPASLAIRAGAGPASEGWDGLGYALVALATVSLGAALVWLFSPLRLQTEMGLYLLVLSLGNSLLPFSLRALVSPVESAQTLEPTA